jgi:hypothetical protein
MKKILLLCLPVMLCAVIGLGNIVDSVHATVLFGVTFPNNEKCEFDPPETFDGEHSLIVCLRNESAWAAPLDEWCNPTGYYYTDWNRVYYSSDGQRWQDIGPLN